MNASRPSGGNIKQDIMRPLEQFKRLVLANAMLVGCAVVNFIGLFVLCERPGELLARLAKIWC